MATDQTGADDAIRRMVEWTVDHVEIEANFEGVDLLLIGDPGILADAPPLTGLFKDSSWELVALPGGSALAVAGPGEGDGPFVWVLGSDDGPLASVDISPRLADTAPGAVSKDVGLIESPSGRVVVGTPESIAYWGRDVDGEDDDSLASFRADWDVAGRLYDSYIVIAHTSPGSACRVVVSPSKSGGVSTISVRFPVPEWLPPPRPIIDRA